MNKPSVHDYISSQLTQLDKLRGCDISGIEAAVSTLGGIRGSILLVGVGKSGIVAQKMCATLNSLSVPSQYLHATEIMHGDLGRVTADDAVIMISRSGNTDEVLKAAYLIQSLGVPSVAIVNGSKGNLTKYTTVSVILPEVTEVDRYNLVPTSSTSMQLVIADAIALAVADDRGFDEDRFGAAHPGGNLGRRLQMTVADVMHDDPILAICGGDEVDTIIRAISRGRVGACVVLEEDQLMGVITDGDLRRMLANPDHMKLKARDICTVSPKSIDPQAKLIDALNLMESHKISQLVVVKGGHYVGMLHIHDCLKAGII